MKFQVVVVFEVEADSMEKAKDLGSEFVCCAYNDGADQFASNAVISSVESLPIQDKDN